MYCEIFVDGKWVKTMERRKKDIQTLEKMRKIAGEEQQTSEMDRMKSQLHMSDYQAAGAIVIIGNKLFDRNSKLHGEGEESIDIDALPQTSMVRQAGRDIEVMALDEIIKEIMNSDEKTVVTYNDDVSKKQGTGSFSVL